MKFDCDQCRSVSSPFSAFQLVTGSFSWRRWQSRGFCVYDDSLRYTTSASRPESDSNIATAGVETRTRVSYSISFSCCFEPMGMFVRCLDQGIVIAITGRLLKLLDTLFEMTLI